MDMTVMEVARDDLGRHRFVDERIEPEPGQAALTIDLAAVTANTVTYGVHGEALGYWRFYPASEAGWGRVPAWGVATVVASRAEGVHEGDRLYGFFVIAGGIVLGLSPTGQAGLDETSAHRAPLAAVYNRYRRWDDSMGDPELTAILRPLHATAYLFDDYLAEHGFMGAEMLVVSSASSKTALAISHAVGAHGTRPRLVGLTSAANRRFVERTGAYDAVLDYAAVETIDPQRAVYVDLAGDRGLRARVHAQFGDALAHSAAIGDTHMGLLGPKADVAGPKPQFFFAPEWLKRRQAVWGPGATAGRLDEAWRGFSDWAAGWLTIRNASGADAVGAAWDAARLGRVPADEGVIVRL